MLIIASWWRNFVCDIDVNFTVRKFNDCSECEMLWSRTRVVFFFFNIPGKRLAITWHILLIFYKCYLLLFSALVVKTEAKKKNLFLWMKSIFYRYRHIKGERLKAFFLLRCNDCDLRLSTDDDNRKREEE